MNAKFYVPFDTAKMLKKAGYPQSGSDMYYDFKGELMTKDYICSLYHYPTTISNDCTAAPAYCEVLDWLVKKEIYIDVDKTMDRVIKTQLWYCFIWGKEQLKGAIITASYPTREQAINAAIIRALEELL